jgi:hypothetical protein
MTQKVDVLISIWNGIIEDVAVLPQKEAKEAWTKWGKNHGYSNYQEFLDELNSGDLVEELRWFTDFDIEKGLHKKEFNPSLRK